MAPISRKRSRTAANDTATSSATTIACLLRVSLGDSGLPERKGASSDPAAL